MITLDNLQPSKGSNKQAFRKGRGVGSGNGKTAGRGYNGYYSRGGSKVRDAFEGGQMPLQRRVPKFGFTNINHITYNIVNLDVLNAFPEGTEVTPIMLKDTGLVKKDLPIKILAKGELKVKLTVNAHKFSQSAKEQIEKLGGAVVVL